MTSPLVHYYIKQSGSGLSAYEGVRYQKGQGFFGRLLRGAIMPLLKFLGKTAVKTGATVASDWVAGKNIKEAAKDRLMETKDVLLEKAAGKLQGYKSKQSGSGIPYPFVMARRRTIKAARKPRKTGRRKKRSTRRRTTRRKGFKTARRLCRKILASSANF